MSKIKIVTTEDILLMMCRSVTDVLSTATNSAINYSAMVQKINKTCLKPDIGCFVLFDGGFSGLVVINFTAPAAMEIYQNYMSNMGIPQEELAALHTSDEVGNVLGELMNQMVGDFTGKVGKELLTSINQNQPKMLTINKEVILSINTNLDRPQARRVTFTTSKHNIFYLELAMDKTEFIQLHDFERQADASPDEIINETRMQSQKEEDKKKAQDSSDADSLLDELGI
jgi:chemotaxis protein CheY-P-specific phosphatase CheC